MAGKVFLYARVSTAEQAGKGDSLDVQQRQATGYAMMRNWTVDGSFVEAGVSGSVPLADRPEGARLLATVRKGDVIIVPKLDRIFRSAVDALVTVEALKEQGVQLHMIDLGGDVTGNGISKLFLTILSAVAEAERDRLRERIRDVKRHLAAQGTYAGGRAPFGFDAVAGRLVANDDQQKALADMQARREAGESYWAIGAAHAMTATSVRRILKRAGAL